MLENSNDVTVRKKDPFNPQLIENPIRQKYALNLLAYLILVMFVCASRGNLRNWYRTKDNRKRCSIVAEQSKSLRQRHITIDHEKSTTQKERSKIMRLTNTERSDHSKTLARTFANKRITNTMKQNTEHTSLWKPIFCQQNNTRTMWFENLCQQKQNNICCGNSSLDQVTDTMPWNYLPRTIESW